MQRSHRAGRLPLGLLALTLVGTALLFYQVGGTSPSDARDRAEDLVDINSASEDELKALPGVGDALASRIIKHRPYNRKDELVERKVVPENVYERIKHQIVAKRK